MSEGHFALKPEGPKTEYRLALRLASGEVLVNTHKQESLEVAKVNRDKYQDEFDHLGRQYIIVEREIFPWQEHQES